MRKKNLEVDIPKGVDTEVHRRHSLKNSIFTRTRIAALSFVLVLALAVTGTLAYLAYTGNQTPNRSSIGEVAVRIGEKTSIDANPAYDTDGEYPLGKDKKVVFVAHSDNPSAISENVTVSILPQVESKQYSDNQGNALSDGYLSFNEEWSALKQETDSDGKTWDYIETSVMKVYLAQGWSTNWTFQSSNGIFRYNKSLSKGEKTDDLISGVVLQDSVKASDYKSVKLAVIAQAVLS